MKGTKKAIEYRVVSIDAWAEPACYDDEPNSKPMWSWNDSYTLETGKARSDSLKTAKRIMKKFVTCMRGCCKYEEHSFIGSTMYELQLRKTGRPRYAVEFFY